jgi:hypothetical protein
MKKEGWAAAILFITVIEGSLLAFCVTFCFVAQKLLCSFSYWLKVDVVSLFSER